MCSLHASHPAIDYVGVYDEFIIFFQVSLSLYVHHVSKFRDINRIYPKSEEFKKQTILQYYRVHFGKSKVIFVYVSPKENGIPNLLMSHASNAQLENVYLGYMQWQGNSVLTELMLNYI